MTKYITAQRYVAHIELYHSKDTQAMLDDIISICKRELERYSNETGCRVVSRIHTEVLDCMDFRGKLVRCTAKGDCYDGL